MLDIVSIQDKLKIKAHTLEKSYNDILKLFCQEELLRRISKSKYQNQVILKGDFLINTLLKLKNSDTNNLDFLLKYKSNSKENIKKLICEIILSDTGNDYITYEVKDILPTNINKRSIMSVSLIGKIASTRIPFKVNFEVDGIIIPKPEEHIMPTQIEGFENPVVTTYSIESIISEKLDSLFKKQDLKNSIKDYFDICYIANTFNFDGRKLQEAIFETLQKRGTSYEKDTFAKIVNVNSNEEIKTIWDDLTKKMNKNKFDFYEAIVYIKTLLEDIFNYILYENEFFGNWDSKNMKWA